MLVLSRHTSQTIVLTLEDGREIRVMPVDIRADKVRLGIEAPRSILVHREEQLERIQQKRTEDRGQGAYSGSGLANPPAA